MSIEPTWRTATGYERLHLVPAGRRRAVCGVEAGEWWPVQGTPRPPCRDCQSHTAGDRHGYDTAIAMSGVSTRRFDYWTRMGYLRAENPAPGSGARRFWPAAEVAVARRMAELVDAGLRPEAAAHAARHDGQLPGGQLRITRTPQTTTPAPTGDTPTEEEVPR